MVEEAFNEISKAQGGKYSKETKLYKGYQWSSLPVTIHNYRIVYKDSVIEIIYEFGNANVGEVKCTISPRLMPAEFEIERSNHFQMLFRKNKSPWSIKCKDDLLKYKLQTVLDSSGVDKLANKEAFEPTIKGEPVEKTFVLHAFYSVAFNRKEESILPMLNFFKELIDKIL